MNIKTALASATILAASVFTSAHAADRTIGFSQIGSESGWRAAETTLTKQQAEERGIDLKFADAQQKQENQIKALRSFIAQGVDAILVAPVVATGWDEVLQEAKDAEIPVILLDRTVDASDDLYMTAVTSDLVHEGNVAGKWLDRLPHFRHEFTPSNGEELQSEFILPLEHAPAALQAVRSLAARMAPLLFVSEIRTGAADECWLSPFYRQQSVALHFTWKPLQAEVQAVLPELEELLRPFGARPHWGKLFTPSGHDWEALYPRFADFRLLAARHDPAGKFRNALLDRLLGVPAASPR